MKDAFTAWVLMVAIWMSLNFARKCCLDIGGKQVAHEFPHAIVASMAWGVFWLAVTRW